MDSREKILSTASDLFLGKGYGVVGTSEICKAAGVNKGTFYHFFPSKADLLVAAIEAYAEDFRLAFAGIAAGPDQPSQKLAALFGVPFRANAAWKSEHGFSQGCLVGNMALELGAVDPKIREATREALASWSAAIRPIIEDMVAAGDLPPLDSQCGAEAVVAMIQGGIVMAKSHNDPERITSLAPLAMGSLAALAA